MNKILDPKENKHSIQKEGFLQLIEVIPDAIIIVNQEGQIEYTNSQALSMFNYTTDELVSKAIEILIPRRYRKNHVQHREGYNNQPIKRPMGEGLELYGEKKDGLNFPVNIMLAPINIGNEPKVISVIRDISILKETTEELKKQSRQLEDMVSALTHDLKTPLIAAGTNYKLLLEEQFGALSDAQKKILQLLTSSNVEALKLVRNLLATFKYETKTYKLILEEVSINELINKASDLVSPLIEEKKINLKFSKIKFKFTCDIFELERVLVNLLTNSIKHTPNGGIIEIKAIKTENGITTISVKDNGEGIPSEDIPKMFNRFWQSRKSNTSFQNTGLGLYLCKQIIEAHKGKIWVESILNKGTKVSFEIPELTNN